MKIGQPADKTAAAAAAAAAASAAAGNGSVRSAAPGPAKTTPLQPSIGTTESSAKVELSSAAATIISSQTKSVNAEFNAEKVAEVSKAIDNKTYKVNAEVIADKLIANAQELLGKVSK